MTDANLYYRLADLNEISELDGNEMVEVVKNGENRRITVTQLTRLGKSAYQIAQDNGFEGDIDSWLASLKGEDGVIGVDGESAYQLAVAGGYEGTVEEWLITLETSMTVEKLQDLLDQQGFNFKDLVNVVGSGGAVAAAAGFLNVLFIHDRSMSIGDEGSFGPFQTPQLRLEMGRLEERGYTYWKNSPAFVANDVTQAEAPERSEVRIYDHGAVRFGNDDEFIEFYGDGNIRVNSNDTEFNYRFDQLALSAYDLALQEGFEGNLIQWLESLKGETGPEGKTALEVIQEVYPLVDTPEKLAAFLKGLRGETGERGDDGIGTRIVAALGSVDDLPDPVIAENRGEGYFIGKNIWLASGGEWFDVGDMSGPPGIGMYIRGTLPNTGSLPNANNQNGDTYIVNRLLYTWDGVMWSEVGQPGPTGQSAYELAVEQGFEGSKILWIASLIGERGPRGFDGPKGETGEKGDDAYALRIIDELDEGTPLPSGRSIGDCYIIGVNIFALTESGWKNLGRFNGASAYDIAVAGGFVGNAAAWLNSLNGTDGTNGSSAYQLAVQTGFSGTLPQWLDSIVGKSAYQSAVDTGFVGTEAAWVAQIKGENGTPGKDLEIDGAVETVGELPAAPSNTTLTYLVGTFLYFGTGGNWIEVGDIRGPAGPKGDDGTNGTNGSPGGVGPQGPVGLGVKYRGMFATLQLLQGVASPVDGNFAVVGTYHYYYDSTAQTPGWQQGPVIVGTNGTNGTNGTPGTNGTNGTNGVDGKNLTAKGRVNTVGELPATGTEVLGTGYLIGTDLYINGASGWFNAGRFSGEAGLSAYQLAQIANPPFTGSMNEWIASLHGLSAYEIAVEIGGDYEDEAEWLLTLKGNDGETGPMGPGVKILGSLPNTGSLPSGAGLQPGDGYLIALHFWGWTGTAWVDCGVIQGPKGEQGIQGQDGLRGLRGLTGERGASIIQLSRDPDALDGIVGDTAVNLTTQGVWLKSNPTTWTFTGFFGGGNVFKPANDGKTYVFKNGAWISFDRYDLGSLTTTGACDLSSANVFKIDNTVGGTKTITFAGAPAGRCMTVLIMITGVAGMLSWPGSVVWSEGTVPEPGTTLTNIVLIWNGTNFVGSLSSKV